MKICTSSLYGLSRAGAQDCNAALVDNTAFGMPTIPPYVGVDDPSIGTDFATECCWESDESRRGFETGHLLVKPRHKAAVRAAARRPAGVVQGGGGDTVDRGRRAGSKVHSVSRRML